MDKEYIDRDAAKNAIYEYICGHTMSKFLSKELLEASKGGAEGAMYEIENVPAADVVSHEQFESVKWERDMLADQLAARWIPVAERVPDVNEKVLFITKTSTKYCGWYTVSNGISYNKGFETDGGFVWLGNVTHWMPLPDAPKEEE